MCVYVVMCSSGCRSTPRGRGCCVVGAVKPRHRGGLTSNNLAGVSLERWERERERAYMLVLHR